MRRRGHDHGGVSSRGLQGSGFSGRGDRIGTKANADKVAKRWGVPQYDSPEDLMRDQTIEILDITSPPDQQPALIKLALQQSTTRRSSLRSPALSP
jgi:hypothetical protein